MYAGYEKTSKYIKQTKQNDSITIHISNILMPCNLMYKIKGPVAAGYGRL